MLAALVSWDFSQLKQSLADIEAEARDKLLKASQHNSILKKTMQELGDEATKTAIANRDAGQAATAAGAAAGQAADNWIKLQNGYRIVIDSIREQISEQEKSVIARDAEGKASVALAQAFGTEMQQRVEQANAAEASAEALQNLAKSRLQELETLKAELVSLQEEGKAHGQLSEARAKQLADLEKTIALRQQDADKAVAQARAARLAAEAAKAEAEAYKDNSSKVAEYKKALLDALDALQRVRDAKAAGKATTEQVTQAELDAGRAAILYRDALNDQIIAIKAKQNAEQAGIDLQRVTVQLAIEQQRSIYDLAKARGDERTAIAAKNEIAKLEIQLLELTAQAKRAEAQAAMASINAKREELKASNLLTDAKKLELEALTKAAQVKEVEARIIDTQVQKLQELRSTAQAAGTSLDALAKQTSNVAKVTGDSTGSISGGWNNVAGAVRNASNAVQEYNQRVAQKYGRPGEGDANVFDPNRTSTRGEKLGEGVEEVGTGGYQFRNKDGMTSDAKGTVQTQGIWTRTLIIDYLKQAGLDADVAEKLSLQFVQPDGSVPYFGTDAQKRWGGQYGTLSDALAKMAEYYKYGDGKYQYAAMSSEIKKNNAVNFGPSKASTPAPAPAPAPATSAPSSNTGGGRTTYVSNITLPSGQTKQARFEDAESQAVTEQLLRDLTSGKGVY